MDRIDRTNRRGTLAGTAGVGRSLALACGLALLMSGVASAATITTPDQVQTIPLTQTNWQPGVPAGSNNPLTFDKFDPALGQLQSVNLMLRSQFNHDIVLRFVTPSTLTMQTSASSVVVRDPNGVSLLTAAPNLIDESRTISNGPFPQSVTIPTILQNANAGPLSLTDPATLAMFTAGSPGEKIGLPVVASSTSAFSSSTGNGSGSINTRASAEVIVSYTYVPEPSTLVVVGLGCVASLFHAKRRRAA